VYGEDQQWDDSFSSFGSFGSEEQVDEQAEEEEEYTLENDDDDDIGRTSNHIRYSVFTFRAADNDEAEVINAILAKHPSKAINV
jgi:hypothetical protein